MNETRAYQHIMSKRKHESVQLQNLHTVKGMNLQFCT